MACVEEVAGVHWGQGDFVDLVFFHPDGFVVSFAIAQALDGFVEVVGCAVGKDIDDFDGYIGVFDIGGDVERCGDGAADFDAFCQWLGGVDLVVDRTYQGGSRGTVADDPLAVLLPVGNQGGFRYKGSPASGTVRLVVLYTSGHTDDAPVHHRLIESGMAFIRKPFTPASLLRKVREVLDGRE